MLIELRILNFAVIESLSLRLEAGLNALTGETGAGKSIIVGALSLLLGERASADVVRTGAERASVEGVFDVSAHPAIVSALAEQGIETEEGLLILRREVAAEGRNRAWINGAASTAALVGEIGRQLVDLHGQHEYQTLLRRSEQRRILDAYADALPLAAEVERAHAHWRASLRELDALDERRREAEQRKDFLRFQAEEIESAELREGEEEELEAEASRLDHAEELARLSNSLHLDLYAADESLSSRLGEMRRTLDHLVRIDPSQQDAHEMLAAALYNLEELGRRMGEYATAIEGDPARLDFIRRRLDRIHRLKLKYGASVGEVIGVGARARAELDTLDRAEFERRQLDQAAEQARTAFVQAAARLSAARARAARRLSKAVGTILPQLGMDGGTMDVVLEHVDEPSPHGAEDVEFRIALNKGFEPRALARIASGGELSRVMLALKTILAGLDDVPTLVFDEVDAGIGGKVAHAVGDKLRDVARDRQVFVITHLPQIASRAQHHLLVRKEERGARTTTTVDELAGEARVAELARLLGGDPESETSLAHAKELLAGKSA
ncbi:MAG TPA: DNA repair protein RecN [Longimicrobiales bacterium]|nr:DNA repair protein RecN [Longimicrobiales bacterium]